MRPSTAQILDGAVEVSEMQVAEPTVQGSECIEEKITRRRRGLGPICEQCVGIAGAYRELEAQCPLEKCSARVVSVVAQV